MITNGNRHIVQDPHKVKEAIERVHVEPRKIKGEETRRTSQICSLKISLRKSCLGAPTRHAERRRTVVGDSIAI